MSNKLQVILYVSSVVVAAGIGFAQVGAESNIGGAKPVCSSSIIADGSACHQDSGSTQKCNATSWAANSGGQANAALSNYYVKLCDSPCMVRWGVEANSDCE